MEALFTSSRRKLAIRLLITIILSTYALPASAKQREWSLPLPKIVQQLPTQTLTYYRTAPSATRFEIGGFLVSFGLVFVDQPLYEWTTNKDCAIANRTWTHLTNLGDPRFHLAVAMLLGMMGSQLGEDMIYALGYTGVNTGIFKATTGMSRPHLHEGTRFIGPTFDERYHGMPSAHTASSTAMATVLHEHYPGSGWVLYPLAGMIGLSRLHLEQHWPSNVVVGAWLGYLSTKHYYKLND